MRFKVIFSQLNLYQVIVEADSEQEAIDIANGNDEHPIPDYIEFGEPDWNFDKIIPLSEDI